MPWAGRRGTIMDELRAAEEEAWSADGEREEAAAAEVATMLVTAAETEEREVTRMLAEATAAWDEREAAAAQAHRRRWQTPKDVR